MSLDAGTPVKFDDLSLPHLLLFICACAQIIETEKEEVKCYCEIYGLAPFWAGGRTDRIEGGGGEQMYSTIDGLMFCSRPASEMC